MMQLIISALIGGVVGGLIGSLAIVVYLFKDF